MSLAVQTLSDPNRLIVGRPHFQLRGKSLYFMVSSRPQRELSANEADIWSAIQNPVSLSDLCEQFPEHVVNDVIADFWRSELCEWVEQDFSALRRRVLVIEPHADDAVLSVGGVMWQRRHECHYVVATMASRSNFTSYFTLVRDYFKVDRVMDIRRKESALFTQMIGGTYLEGGLTDIVLRYHDADWTLDYYKSHRMSISIATSRAATEDECKRWMATVCRLVAQTPSDEIWIPLGSPHSDHALTMNACIAAFVAHPELIAGRLVRVYQDVPYATRFPNFTDEMTAAFGFAGIEMAPEVVPIGDVMEQKLRLISLYASQFKMHTMSGDVKACALTHEPAQAYSELLWSIKSWPRQLSTRGIAAVSGIDTQQENSAKAWLARNRMASRVRLLLLMPTGQWREDFKKLGEMFPDARFDIYGSPEAVVEVNEIQSDRVTVRQVGNGAKAWVSLCLKLVASRSMPSLFFAGERRLGVAKWLSRLWLQSDSLVVASMDRVVRCST